MADSIEVNCAVQQLGCNDSKRKITSPCENAGRKHFLNAPDARSARGTVCVLAPKCAKCGYGPTVENLHVSPFSELVMMPTSVTIYRYGDDAGP